MFPATWDRSINAAEHRGPADSHLAIQLPPYEGPFEPLLALIRRDEYSVGDIPIAELVRQFSTYIGRTEKLDLELGAEFVDAASWLIYLKSLLLLPKTDVGKEKPNAETPLSREQLELALEFLRTQFAQLGWHQQLSQVPPFEQLPLQSGKVQAGQPTIQDVIEPQEMPWRRLKLTPAFDWQSPTRIQSKIAWSGLSSSWRAWTRPGQSPRHDGSASSRPMALASHFFWPCSNYHEKLVFACGSAGSSAKSTSNTHESQCCHQRDFSLRTAIAGEGSGPITRRNAGRTGVRCQRSS